MAQSRSLEGEILGITGLASVWRPLQSLWRLLPHPYLKMTAAWDLTVKWPFTDQPDEEGYEKTSTTLVSCESSNDQSSKTI